MTIPPDRLFATIGALKVENDLLREQNATLQRELQGERDKQNVVSTERPDDALDTLPPTSDALPGQ